MVGAGSSGQDRGTASARNHSERSVGEVLGIGVRVVGSALLVLFLLGGTVGTGVVPVDRAAAGIVAGVTGGQVSAAPAGSIVVDTDRDGLADTEEPIHGTDSDRRDTDGDGIPDGWEIRGETPAGVSLPGSDPLRLDLYVVVQRAPGVTALSGDERHALRSVWARMPVENPDGSTGISLHLLEGRRATLPHEVRLRSVDADAVRSFAHRFHDERYLGGYDCVAHQVLLVPVTADVRGVAAEPGWVSVVDGDATRRFGTPYTVRVGTATHELLHNVVGELNPATSDPHHSRRGWLSHGAYTENQFLSAATAQILEDGFETRAGGC